MLSSEFEPEFAAFAVTLMKYSVLSAMPVKFPEFRVALVPLTLRRMNASGPVPGALYTFTV